jgi:hypothetical protein
LGGEYHGTCQKLFAKKVKGGKTFFPVVFSRRFVLIAFLAVSLHEELENRPENLKKSPKKREVGRYVAFLSFFLSFLSAPCGVLPLPAVVVEVLHGLDVAVISLLTERIVVISLLPIVH